MAESHSHHHEDHPDFLQHHFESPQQQFEAGKLGMWLFLATEILLFGGLFVAYAVWRGNNPELFAYGQKFLDVSLGATNTVVLILSSLTIALSVTYAQLNRQRALIVCLILTFIGAGIFMGIKYVEYSEKYWEGMVPGAAFYNPPPDPARSAYWQEDRPVIDPDELAELQLAEAGTEDALVLEPEQPRWDPDRPAMVQGSSIEWASLGPGGVDVDRLDDLDRDEKRRIHPLQDPDRPANLHMFFNIYFMMTGLHGIHVVVGMIVIGWLIVRSFMGHFGSQYFTPIDLGGLYWHVVDLIWIFLFPLFYL